MKPQLLSCQLTVLYKLVLPILLGLTTLFLWIGAVALLGEKDAEVLFVLALIFTGLMLLLIPSMKLQRLSFDDDYLYINNFKKTRSIPLERVKDLKKSILYYYKVVYEDEDGQFQKSLFLPDTLERIEAMGGVPESIVDLRKKISA